MSQTMYNFEALMDRAREAATAAYVPYCRFPVGAALQAEDGRIFTGVNVDNSSSPLTLCAERSAVSTAVTAGMKEITAVAVYAQHDSVSPCGGCRQVLAEFASDECVVCFAWEGQLRYVPLDELLPFTFSLPSGSSA